MFPHILLTSLSVLIKLHYIRYTGISSSLVECGTHVNRFALPPPLSNLFGYIFGSSGKWSDKVCIERKKTAEHFVYLNNHKQIYNNEQQFSISCMGALQPWMYKRGILAYKRGILAWYDCHISTGRVEGINNKIKVMKRNAYSFRDEEYFKLRLYVLRDCRITRNVGWT